MSICSAVQIDRLPLYAKPILLTTDYSGPDYPPFDWSHIGSSRAAAVNQTCVGSQTGPMCSSDCKTFMVCIGDPTPDFQMACTDMASNTPYCVGTTCTSTPNVTNPSCQASFVCTSEGTFPGKIHI